MKIKDYLILKEIELFLDNKRQELINENDGYSNKPITDIEKLLIGLRKVLSNLENED